MLTTSTSGPESEQHPVFGATGLERLREASVEVAVLASPGGRALRPRSLAAYLRTARRAARKADVVAAHGLASAFPTLVAGRPFVLELSARDAASGRRQAPWSALLVRRARLVVVSSPDRAAAARRLGARDVRILSLDDLDATLDALLDAADRLDTAHLPMPPPELRSMMAIRLSPSWFTVSGLRSRHVVEAALARQGRPLAGQGAVLDFGRGAGRVLRLTRDIAGSVDLRGADLNPALVEWCARELPFASVARNDLEPPLPYPDGSFGAVWAFSVFTHLPEHLQRPWILELRRVLEPGGLLLFTTLGNEFAHRALDEDEARRFAAGRLVIRGVEHAGSNDCAALHPFDYVRDTLSSGLELAEFTAGTRGLQDRYVLRR